MNDNEMVNDGVRVDNTYRATTNLNTAIENPQINMNSAVGVNIKDVGANNMANDRFSNDNMVNPDFSNQAISVNINNTVEQTNSSDNVMANSSSSYGMGNQFITNTPSVDGYSNQNVTPSFHEEVSYEPTMEEKKEKSHKLVISRDLKITLFIVFILFVFVLIMPYIYDFFKNLQLVVTG